MDHKKTVKKHGRSIEQLREKRRQEDIVSRKQKREQILIAKRVRMDSECEDEVDDVTQAEVKKAAEDLKQGDSRKESLRLLRRAFGQGTLYIDEFMSVDGGLASVVGVLSGNDAELQLEAACCVTNLAAGMHDHVLTVAKAAGPYLITYLSGQNAQLQEQCSWALGNIAGDSPECRTLLKAQGALTPLIKLLQSPEAVVVRTAAFALSNLARGPEDLTKEMMEAGIASALLKYIEYDQKSLDTAAEVAWILTFLTARLEYDAELVKHGILPKLVKMAVSLSQNPSSATIELVTPIMRCLGNICSGPDEYSEEACSNDQLLPALGYFLKSENRHIMKKECLWVLSNMTGDTKVCDVFLKNNLHKTIIPLLHEAYDVRKEAAFCLCNLACQGGAICEELLASDGIEGIVHILKSADTEILKLGLNFCEMMFRMTKSGVSKFEEAGGMDCLEITEYHADETVRSITSDLLEKYFEKEVTMD